MRDFAGVWICKPASLMMAICLARFNRARVVVPNAPLSFKAVIMCWEGFQEYEEEKSRPAPMDGKFPRVDLAELSLLSFKVQSLYVLSTNLGKIILQC
ncbi:hypothetical protein WJX79_004674 [Trebouxia sp. C0005]